MLFRVSSSFRNLITLGSGMIRSANCHTESSKVAEKRSIWHSEGKALEEKGRWPSPTYQAVALQALASAALSILVAYVVLCAMINSTLTQQVKQPVPIRHQESGKIYMECDSQSQVQTESLEGRQSRQSPPTEESVSH